MSSGKTGIGLGIGLVVGTLVGAAVAYCLDDNRRDRLVDNVTGTANKFKDSVVEGYYDAKSRYMKYRNRLTHATDEMIEEIGEEFDGD